MASDLPALRLRANADRRLRAGHLWIYSNEVDVQATPLKAMQSGAQVQVQASNGRPLGLAYVNPNTLICARIINRELEHRLDKSLIKHRLNIALSLRERVFESPHYRLVYGDSDLLPGLVVDRFGDYLVVQTSTAGMEAVRGEIVDALREVLKPAGILFKNDSKAREIEGLGCYVETAFGEVPERVELLENGVRFLAPVRDGQKTGWFYDHRMNRARLSTYAKGARVLDVFSYVGGWGVQAAAFGASAVVCVDSSGQALELVRENAALNGVQDRVRAERGQAFEVMKAMIDAGERFDVVVADPPAFIKRRKDAEAGAQAYRRLNELAMRLLVRDGILFSASCSMHLPREQLLDIVRGSARHVDRNAQLLEQGGQGADHPIHPAIPETEYLKNLIVRVY